MAKLTHSIDRVRKAVGLALNRTSNVTGGESDPHLRIYNGLKDEHFNALVNHYGADNVIRYIKHMEALRLQKKEE